MPTTKTSARDENIAAISAEFHGRSQSYKNFYDKYAGLVGGFPGIWLFMVDAADAFYAVEITDHLVAGEDFSYIEAIFDFSRSLLRAKEFPNLSELQELARKAIEKNKY